MGVDFPPSISPGVGGDMSGIAEFVVPVARTAGKVGAVSEIFVDVSSTLIDS